MAVKASGRSVAVLFDLADHKRGHELHVLILASGLVLHSEQLEKSFL